MRCATDDDSMEPQNPDADPEEIYGNTEVLLKFSNQIRHVLQYTFCKSKSSTEGSMQDIKVSNGKRMNVAFLVRNEHTKL